MSHWELLPISQLGIIPSLWDPTSLFLLFSLETPLFINLPNMQLSLVLKSQNFFTNLVKSCCISLAGIPQDIFVPVLGGGSAARHLLAQPIDGVFFTGSLVTGIKIAQQTAGKMIPTQLELGGKDPVYVTEDVDVEKAAKALADGSMYNSGQSCCSVERIYVHKNIYDDFVKIFVNEVKSFPVGDPMSEETYFGPLTLPSQSDLLNSQVKDAQSKGAKVLLGGEKGSQPHSFLPTVLVNVNHSMGNSLVLSYLRCDAQRIVWTHHRNYGSGKR